MSKPVLRAIFFVVVMLVVVSGLGFGVLSLVEGLDTAGRRLTDLAPGWMVLAWLLWTLSVVSQGWRWRALLPMAERPGGLTMTWILFGSNVLNLALPGPVGELGAAWYLRQRFGVPTMVGLASTLLARLMAFLVFGIATLALWPLLIHRIPEAAAPWLNPLILAMGVMPLPVIILAKWPMALAQFAAQVAGLIPFIGDKIAGRFLWVGQCLSSLATLPWYRWAESIGWSVFNLGLFSVSKWCVLHAAGVPGDLLGSAFLTSIAAVASIFSVVSPSGIGAVDAVFVLVFPVTGVNDTGAAVFCAIAARWVQTLSLAVGIPAMAYLLARVPKEAEQIRADLGVG